MVVRADISCAELEQLHDHCGVFAWGQESAGIVASNGEHTEAHRGTGLVSQVFSAETVSKLPGHIALGHTRYSTAGGSSAVNCQPFQVHTLDGQISLAHNGQLVHADRLRQNILKHGVGMMSKSDSEIIAHLLCAPPRHPHSEHVHGVDFEARIAAFMDLADTSYSLGIMYRKSLYAIRDPYGNRPLCIGKIEGTSTATWVISSESCSFSVLGAQLVREVEPGEVLRIDDKGLTTVTVVRPGTSSGAQRALAQKKSVRQTPALCIFEYIYFCRPDTILENQMVDTVRQRCGAQLFAEHFIEADVVSMVPASASAAAIGFAQASSIPFNHVFHKLSFAGRTFIQPSDQLRKQAINRKFTVLTENVKGKRVVLIDDSIVRGNTMVALVKLLRQHGAREVHLRIASPPLQHPCYMGIDIPEASELIANQIPMAQLAAHFHADTLEFLSKDGLAAAVRRGLVDQNKDRVGHCTACFTGDYPVQLEW